MGARISRWSSWFHPEKTSGANYCIVLAFRVSASASLNAWRGIGPSAGGKFDERAAALMRAAIRRSVGPHPSSRSSMRGTAILPASPSLVTRFSRAPQLPTSHASSASVRAHTAASARRRMLSARPFRVAWSIPVLNLMRSSPTASARIGRVLNTPATAAAAFAGPSPRPRVAIVQAAVSNRRGCCSSGTVEPRGRPRREARRCAIRVSRSRPDAVMTSLPIEQDQGVGGHWHPIQPRIREQQKRSVSAPLPAATG